jgi:hypothetical protein
VNLGPSELRDVVGLYVGSPSGFLWDITSWLSASRLPKRPYISSTRLHDDVYNNTMIWHVNIHCAFGINSIAWKTKGKALNCWLRTKPWNLPNAKLQFTASGSFVVNAFRQTPGSRQPNPETTAATFSGYSNKMSVNVSQFDQNLDV